MAQDWTDSDRQLRKTVDDVERAMGDLRQRYEEPDAIRLIKALGGCDTFVSSALLAGHKDGQEKARREFHVLCISTSNAIRRAIGYPGRASDEQHVVKLTEDLQGAIDRLRAAFRWD